MIELTEKEELQLHLDYLHRTSSGLDLLHRQAISHDVKRAWSATADQILALYNEAKLKHYREGSYDYLEGLA